MKFPTCAAAVLALSACVPAGSALVDHGLILQGGAGYRNATAADTPIAAPQPAPTPRPAHQSATTKAPLQTIAGRPAPATPSMAERRSIAQGARRAFGLGLNRDDQMLSVAGRTMALRRVTSHGHQYAVLRQRGIPLTLSAHPDLSAQVRTAASTASGCQVGPQVWRKTWSNGAYPGYVVHLLC